MLCTLINDVTIYLVPGIHINAPNVDSFSGKNESECCGICMEVSECTAYSWNGDFDGTCYLKSVTEPKFLDASVHSGIKSCAGIQFVHIYTNNSNLLCFHFLS